jgi:hypothetical protein
MAQRASLDQLRAMIGSVSTKDDDVLAQCLEAAGTWVYDRISVAFVTKPEIVQAVLMLASRLYKRRQSPEGIVTWDEVGPVRVLARDPDIERLIEQYIDAGKVWGVA